MDATNISLKNFMYRGGDDCVAIKPRSFDIRIENLTCHGGNGIAIGSLGQYLEDNTVENIHINNAKGCPISLYQVNLRPANFPLDDPL